MNTRSLAMTAAVVSALAVLTLDGCYTKLMPFRDAVEVRRSARMAAESQHGSGGSADLNYRDNCLSCHSEAELNDRAFDMDQAGLYTVHGLTYDPYGWSNPYTQPPWWNPTPGIGYAPSGGGLVPVITTAPVKNEASTSSNARRRRTSGSDRTNSGSSQQGATTSASQTPATTSTSTTTTTSTPPPAVTAPTQQSQPSSDTRSRSNGSEDTHTRKSGSGRD